jgi:hypothetical protein
VGDTAVMAVCFEAECFVFVLLVLSVRFGEEESDEREAFDSNIIFVNS